MDSTLEWRRDTFERYAGARRRAHIPGYRLETLPDVTRHFPASDSDEALLSFARFDPDRAARRIEEELGAMASRGLAAEWKVHDFDSPADLKDRLLARGLTCHHVEALMVLEMDSAHACARAVGGVAIERARGVALEEIVRFQEEVWECRLPWLLEVLGEMTDPIYCARADGGRVVGSGWIDFHGGSEFAQLCGGAVAELHRGRGVYSALFDVRIAEAKVRGTRFLAVDAAPMSRPILERRGFRFVCHTHPMRTRPFDTGAVTRA